VGANDGGVEDDGLILSLKLKATEDLCPMPTQRPIREPIENRLPGAESFGKIAPRNACSSAVDDGVDEPSILERWLRSSSRRHEKTYHRPLGIGHGVAVRHASVLIMRCVPLASTFFRLAAKRSK
jgi:hypothetical protein